MRIKSVRLTNYKRFVSLTLNNIPDSARLVVLLGPNGCGKSSVFDAFLAKAQRNNYTLQGQFADYYQRDPSSEATLRSIREVAKNIDITFHDKEPASDQWPSVFYMRTAYRNEADFQLETLGRVSPSAETPRFARIIDPDQAVSDNYRRLGWKRIADLDGDAPGTTTFKQYREESLRELQDAMAKLFANPPLALQDFGGIQTTGVFRFAKGTASNFHYKNLSAGEKAAFDLLLDMYVKRSEYADAIYCIDEPEAHTSTALHSRLLEVILDMTPPESQLWIATHSIGFVRKAYELMRQQSSDVAFIDFSEHNLDQEVEIIPSVPSRLFWQRAYQVALDDLADLIAPAHIVICEGPNTKADKSFDATCYNELFAEAHPDTLFVSYGNTNEVAKSEPLIAVLQAVARGATISRAIDRDEMTENAREQKILGGLRVLRRRELENYLYDPEVLKTFLANNERESAIEDVLGKQQELLAGSPVATADMKMVTQKLLAAIRQSTGIANLGNNRIEFAQQHLVPALRGTPTVFQELEEGSALMPNGLFPYPAYKPSGVEWLGDVPEHWDVRRLRTVAEMRVSNVDKHTKEDEVPARLCNYVDVYKNDRITPAMHFMAATASWDEIERFRLERGDVLITKDSETWDDIGVPALVAESAYDLICGYHLALLRPFKEILGAYLNRNLQSKALAYQFHVRANGVTRYGLTHNGIQSVCLPLPPPPEQAAIVRYLDYVERRIRRYVTAKRKLLALLEEEKQAVVNRAVTRGLDPNVRLKPSGVEWLGDVPEHWEVIQLGRIGVFSKGSGGTKDDEVPDGIPCVRYGDLYTTHKYFISQTRSYVSPAMARAYTQINRGDVLFPTSGETIEEIGKSAVNLMHTQVLCGGDLIIFRPTVPMEPKFAGYALDCLAAQTQKSLMGRGITIMHIYSSQLKYLWLPLPPLPEQAAIVEYLDKTTADIDIAIARARRQIELVQEYRTRLIADVVTGKLDVREAAAQLPDEADDDVPMDEDALVLDNMNDVSLDAIEATEENRAFESEVTA